jgi:hypothetical protein
MRTKDSRAARDLARPTIPIAQAWAAPVIQGQHVVVVGRFVA